MAIDQIYPQAGQAIGADGADDNLEPSASNSPPRRVRRSITTGLLPDKMLSGEILSSPPASMSDFSNAPVREIIPYTADPKTAVRSRAREMAKLYGEDSGTYLNFVVRPGMISAAFYPREAYLLGESVRDMVGDRGGDNYIWCERSLSECYIVVVMDGEVRTDLSQPQQTAGQEVRQWLFTLRRHLSQIQEAQQAAVADKAADKAKTDNDEEADRIDSEQPPVDAPLPQMPKLFLRNIAMSDIGISGGTAAHVESLDQDILEWCWDNPEHIYPLLPAKRALRMVFSRESRWLRSVVLNIASVVLVVTGLFYAFTVVYQRLQEKETAEQLAEVGQARSLLDEVPDEELGDIGVIDETVDGDWDNLANRQLDEYLAAQRDAGYLFNWVLQSLLDLGGDVNSDTAGGGGEFHRLMERAVWSTLNNLLIVELTGSDIGITSVHDVISNDPDFPYSVRSFSSRRTVGGKLTLQRNPAREVARLNESWLARLQPTDINNLGDSVEAPVDIEDLLLLDSSLVGDEDGGGLLGGEATKPSLPERKEWLLREWMLFLRAMNAQNIRLYEEQREHYRLYEIRGDIPEVGLDVWRWFGEVLYGRAVLLHQVELSFGRDPQRLLGHVRLGITLPLLVGDPLNQDLGAGLRSAPLPDPSEELVVRQKVEVASDNQDRAARGRRRGGVRRR